VLDKVVFTGFISNDDLQVIIENSLAIVFPSLYEGFGMPVIEGMAAGKPVAASREASIPEVAGDAALYFDPYDVDDMCEAIHEITSNEDLRRSLIEKGKVRVKNFSNKEEMVDKYISLMESVMNADM
jgi:glycosyltransferase involved in cell wall biosynthesis